MAKKPTSFKTINLFEVSLLTAIIHNDFYVSSWYNNNRQAIVSAHSDSCHVWCTDVDLQGN